MEKQTHTEQTSQANQPAGSVILIYGKVEAQSEDGTLRILQPNSPIFEGDRIITASDGMVSVVFNDAAKTQLDLGRMSDATIDSDVFSGGSPQDINEAAVEIEQIQEALLAGDFDPTIELEAPAAGPDAATAASDGGGISAVKFELTAEEVTPESGAETRGISENFLDPDRQALEIPATETLPQTDTPVIGTVTVAAAPIPVAGVIAPPAPPTPPTVTEPPVIAVVPEPPVITVTAPPVDPGFSPLAGIYSGDVDEAGLTPFGNDTSASTTLAGTFTELGISFGGNGPGSVLFNNDSGTDPETYTSDMTDPIVIDGEYGTLTVNPDGSWVYEITSNTTDHDAPSATGGGDTVNDLFTFTVTDSAGNTAAGNLDIDILDDGPILRDTAITRVVEEEALDNDQSKGIPDDQDSPEDSWFNTPGTDNSATVTGNLSEVVSFGADQPGSYSLNFADGVLPTLFSQGEEVTYIQNGDTLEAWTQEDGQDGRLVFTFQVEATGEYTFTLIDQLDHVVDDNTEGYKLRTSPEDTTGVGEIDFSLLVSATDGDGDSVTLESGQLTFIVVDDIPEVDITQVADTAISAKVEEDGMSELSGDDGDASEGNKETGDTNADDETGDSDAGNLHTLFMAEYAPIGADEEDSVPVLTTWLDDDTSGLTDLYSQGEKVSYDVNEDGNTLTASTTSGTVFTLTVNQDGTWTFDLDNQLDHVADTNTEGYFLKTGPDDTTGVDGIDFSSILMGTADRKDFDGDQATDTTGVVEGSFIVRVQDDTPEIGSPQDSILANEAGNTLTASLDVESGSDKLLNTEITLVAGTPVVSVNDTPLTSNNINLVWQDNGDGSWSAVPQGTTNPVFTVDIDSESGTYSVVQQSALDGATATDSISFSDALNGGKQAEALFGDGTITDNGTSTTYSNGLYLYATGSKDLSDPFGWQDNAAPTPDQDTFGSNPLDVNYSAAGIGTGTAQKIAGQGSDGDTRISEILSLKIVSGAVIADDGSISSYDLLPISSATISFDHLGYNETAYFTLWLNGEQVSDEITLQPLKDDGSANATDPIEVGTAGGNASDEVTVTLSSADTQTGTSQFDEVRFESGSDKVENAAEYRVVSVDITREVEGFDQTVEIPFQITDADGDIDQGDFSITFDADGNIDAATADTADGDISDSGMVISGSSEADNIIGTEFDDVIFGNEGDDSIGGGAGNDTILGGSGNDTISGGSGEDYLYGEEGNDILVGGTENDQLIGGIGDDVLSGNEGSDTLVGDDVDFTNPLDSDIVEDSTEDELFGGGGIDTGGDNPAGADITIDVEFGEDDLDALIPPPDPAV